MRKLASIQKITGINPIPNADNIEVASVLGWKVVVLKNQFKVGDSCVYCEIDSFLPEMPEYEFLRASSFKMMDTGRRGFRLRTIKLRGQISQGLILPLPDAFRSLDIGTDVADLLGIILYERFVEESTDIKGDFPGFLKKTDEERVQNLINDYPELRKHTWIITEKVDGKSITVYLKDGEFGVCIRNLEIKKTNTGVWRLIEELKIEEKLRKIGQNLALQGEFFGHGVQGNPYKLNCHKFSLFRKFDINTYSFGKYDEFVDFCNKEDFITVPILQTKFTLPENIEDLILMADGESVFGGKREGIVLVADDTDNRLSFKIVSNKKLLKDK
jgi:RNA ligase (TIGR02306 family)